MSNVRKKRKQNWQYRALVISSLSTALGARPRILGVSYVFISFLTLGLDPGPHIHNLSLLTYRSLLLLLLLKLLSYVAKAILELIM